MNEKTGIKEKVSTGVDKSLKKTLEKHRPKDIM